MQQGYSFEDKDVVFVGAKEGESQLDFSNLQWGKFHGANIVSTLYTYSMITG
jgi:hypothetical protein